MSRLIVVLTIAVDTLSGSTVPRTHSPSLLDCLGQAGLSPLSSASASFASAIGEPFRTLSIILLFGLTFRDSTF